MTSEVAQLEHRSIRYLEDVDCRHQEIVKSSPFFVYDHLKLDGGKNQNKLLQFGHKLQQRNGFLGQ